MSTVDSHSVILITDHPDRFSGLWSIQCGCGDILSSGVSLRDVVNTYGAHTINAAFGQAVDFIHALRGNSVAVDRGDVRRDRRWFHWTGLSRNPPTATGPKPIPRHYLDTLEEQP